MKIMFTNSPLHFSHGHTFTQPDWQTLVLPYLAGIAGDKHDIKLIDNMDYSLLRSNNILKSVRDFKPDVLGFSIIASRDIFNSMKVLEKVRDENPSLKIIVGGQAGTYYHEWLLKKGADLVAHKEGEKTLVELLEAIEEKERDFSSIKGISYDKGGEIYKTEEREMIKNLDDSPLPRWDLMKKKKSKWFKGEYTGSIEISRGCPFKCNFCAITSFWEGSYRTKSVERILEEMRILKKDGRTHLYLADDNFAMNSKKHSKLFDAMLKENLDMKFFAQIRTDTIVKNPEMMKLAAEAGFYGALVGFDTYDVNMFNDITKEGSRDLNIKASKILRDNKIAIFGSHIYGLPTQKNPEEFEITFQMGRKHSDLFRMPYFSPLPFTKGYEEVSKVNPLELSEVPSEEEYARDFRPRVGDEEYQKKMQQGYDDFMHRHNFSLSEIKGALFNPNPNVRILKKRGYIATARHKIYAKMRKLNLTDI